MPELASDLASLRAALGKPPHPLLVFVTASGNVDLLGFHASLEAQIANQIFAGFNIAKPPGASLTVWRAQAISRSCLTSTAASRRSRPKKRIT